MSEERSTNSVAYEALHLARQNQRDQDAHEDLCAERYRHIGSELGRLNKVVVWAGTLALSIILAFLGFLMKVQFDSINALQRAEAQRAHIIQQGTTPPQVIIQPPNNQHLGATIERR